jgi:hypothetical protein
MADDFEQLLTTLVNAWDRQFPTCCVSLTHDLEQAELLADFNKLMRRTRERLARTLVER